jgi:RNA polymerase sigma factor (sigma-70 family)
MSDELLVKGCLRGEPRYQQTLYDKYKVEMFMLCLRYSKNRAEAEDFLQDGFMQVFRDLHQFDLEKGSLQGWVRKVVLNKVLQQLRKKKLQFAPADVSEYANVLPMQAENILSMLSAKEITQLIQDLPEGYKTVFNLYMVEGYSHQEIADTFGISVNTSKTQLHKARLALQIKVTDLISA